MTRDAAHAQGGGDCGATMSIGVSPDVADTVVLFYETRGYGETFYAPRTKIRSISVWRPVEFDSVALPLQVTLMGVDSLGQPDRTNVLGFGPILVVYAGDGIHPVEYRFEFDPPFLLPSLGQYFFRIHIADCFGGFLLSATTANAYPEGQPWFIFGNRYFCGGPTHPDLEYPNWDLAFNIEFCDVPTPTRRTSWGKLKREFRDNQRRTR